jgi:Zn-dependent protease with chaperone function
MTRARLFDGRTALDRDVDVQADGKDLSVIEDGMVVDRVAASDLVALESTHTQRRYGRNGMDGWRLIMDEPVEPDVLALLPGRHRLDPALRRWPMVVAIAFTAIITAALVALIAAPYAVAKRLPQSWEDRLGEAYSLPAGMASCGDPAAQAALDRLADRLDPSARADGIRLSLLDVDEANAAALPGRQIVVFKGILGMEDDPDALAAIVAHELAHVRRRHVAAAIMRQLGIGTAVTLAGGGSLAGAGGDLLALRYTRGAEAEADDDAIAMIDRAGIDPRPTGKLFRDFAKLDQLRVGGSWLASHPASEDRAKRFDASWRRDRDYRPAMPAKDFAALKAACADPSRN